MKNNKSSGEDQKVSESAKLEGYKLLTLTLFIFNLRLGKRIIFGAGIIL